MCIHERIFSGLRLLCDPKMLWHVAIDIEVEAAPDDTQTLKPFKVVVYWQADVETMKAEADKALANVERKLEQLSLTPPATQTDDKKQESIWNEAKITELYSDFYKDERYGFRGVEFRPLKDAPETRKLHPAALCTMLIWQSVEHADKLRKDDLKRYNTDRDKVLEINSLSPEDVSADLEFSIHKEIGVSLMAKQYGTSVKLDDHWHMFRHATLLNVMHCMNTAAECDGNASDEKEEEEMNGKDDLLIPDAD